MISTVKVYSSAMMAWHCLSSSDCSTLHTFITFSFADVFDRKVEERQQEANEKRERNLQELRDR